MKEGGTLRDQALARSLERDGFVVVHGLADAADVVAWRALFAETHPAQADSQARRPLPGRDERDLDWRDRQWPGRLFMTGMDELDPAGRARVEDDALPRWERLTCDLFVGHRSLLTTFVMKWPGDDGVLPLHQDPTFVDERRYRAVTVWLALDDCGPELRNGPLHVVPGSHLAGDEVRGIGTQPTYAGSLRSWWDRAEPVSLRAGDAVLLDGRLLHGSPPNRSHRARLAVAACFVPADAPVLQPASADGLVAGLVEVGPEFYRARSPRHLREEPPLLDGYPVLDTVPVVTLPLTQADPE